MVVSPLKSVDTSTWLTRAEVTKRCGVSSNTITNWVKRKRLHPRRAVREIALGITRPVQVFDPAEIALRTAAHARQASSSTSVVVSDGEVAARAFEFFEQGVSPRDIVMRLREPPQRIAELRERWEEFGGCELVLTPVAREELERVVGPFEGIAGLVERVKSLFGARASAPASPRTA